MHKGKEILIQVSSTHTRIMQRLPKQTALEYNLKEKKSYAYGTIECKTDGLYYF